MADQDLIAILLGSVLAGMFLESLRARWTKRSWRARNGFQHKRRRDSFRLLPSPPPPITDAAEQLRIVMTADFEKRRLLSKAEARVLYAAEKAIKEAKLNWRVMAQVSLGEVLSSPDKSAYAAINSKRVDMLIISSSGVPLAAVEYQGEGHYQGSAAARDAVKKEALRKAGIRYIEVLPEHNAEKLAQEILSLSGLEHATPAGE